MDIVEKKKHHIKDFANSVKLTRKNRKFVECYCDITNPLTYGNATRSAIAAGYSERSAHASSAIILKNNRVQEYIKELDELVSSQVYVNKDRWLYIGFDFLKNFQNENAKVRVWEIIGRCKGFITNELPQDGKQLALFQQIINQAPTDITTGPSDSSSDNINVGNVVEASVVVEDNQTTVEVSSTDS